MIIANMKIIKTMKNIPTKNKSQNKNPQSTSWGNVAGWYDNLLEKSTDSYQEKVILPNLLRIVDPKAGKKILDLACGQGYFSRIFARNGAQVTGCDLSPELVDLAKKNSPEDISYFVATAEKFGDEIISQNRQGASLETKFDVITIVLAIQNIEDMRSTFLQCAKYLETGDLEHSGRLIIILNHPTFRIPKGSSWGWDAKSHKQYRRVDAYMTDEKIKIDMTPGAGAKHVTQGAKNSPSATTISFHRPLQSYFKALSSAGLAVTRLEEWISHRQSQEGPRGAEEDRTRKEIPLFMCIEARRIS